MLAYLMQRRLSVLKRWFPWRELARYLISAILAAALAASLLQLADWTNGPQRLQNWIVFLLAGLASLGLYSGLCLRLRRS